MLLVVVEAFMVEEGTYTRVGVFAQQNFCLSSSDVVRVCGGGGGRVMLGNSVRIVDGSLGDQQGRYGYVPYGT